MSVYFLLCDPALVVPPSPGLDTTESEKFWTRLVEWSSDPRLKLGEESQRTATELLASKGWPDNPPQECPAELRSVAIPALNRILTAVRSVETVEASEIPDPIPDYLAEEDLKLAWIFDAISHSHHAGLLAFATRKEHWAKDCDEVTFTKDPPIPMRLTTEPNHEFEDELDARVGGMLAGKRLFIVGGLHSPGPTLARLDERFPTLGEVVWVKSEKHRKPDYSPLETLGPTNDLVVANTAKIGHAVTTKTRALAAAAGVTVLWADGEGDIGDVVRDAVLVSDVA